MAAAFAPLGALFSKFDEARAKLGLPCPGNYEGLHREIKGVFPTLHLVDGAKIDLTSALSPNFQVSHSFSWGSAAYPPSYNFMAIHHTSKLLLTGQVDHDGNLSARANYNWIPAPIPEQPPQPAPGQPPTPPTPPPSNRPSSTSKLQAQFAKQAGHNTVQFEHDFVGSDFSVNIKAINPNPFDKPPSYLSPAGGAAAAPSAKKLTSGSSAPSPSSLPSTLTGIFSVAYLQSISKSWALGGEFQYQRLNPDAEDPALTFAARWAPPPTPLTPPPGLPAGVPSPYMPVNPSDPTESLTTTYQPSTGLLHSSYWKKINQRLEVAAELQMLLTPEGKDRDGRRDGIASVGFKVDTAMSTVRGMVDSQGRVSAFLDERLTPGLSLQLSGELDYAKGGGGQGKVGIGFVFEA